MANEVTVIPAPDDRYVPGYKNNLGSVGPRLVETRVAFSLYGTAIPVSYGQRILNGNVLWALPLSEVPVVETGDTTYTYYGTFAVSFGYPGDTDANQRQLLRVWADGRLILDNRSTGRSVARAFRYRWYDGSETQTPDPTITADKGNGATPAFRGQMYMVITDLPLRFFDNKIPFIQVEVGDVDTTGNLVTAITAAGENNNDEIAHVNWATDEAFLFNDGLSPSGMFRYNINNNTFAGGQSYNTLGLLQDGVNCFGIIGSTALYIPWLNAFAGTPESSIDPTNTLFLADALTGSVIGYLIDSVGQAFIIRAGLIPAETPITVIVAITPHDIVNFCGWDGNQLYRGGDLLINTPFAGTGTVAFFGESTQTDIAFYCVDDAQNDTLARAVITEDVAIGVTSPSIDLDYLPYGGSEIIPPNIVAGVYCPDFLAVLVFYANGEACLTDTETKVDIWRITGLPQVPDIVDGTALLQMGDQTGGLVAYVIANTVVEIDLTAGTFRQFTLASNTLASGTSTFDSHSRTVIGRGTIDGKLKKVKYEYAAPPTITIGHLITQIALRMGYLEADIEIDVGVDAEIYGAIFTEAISLSEIGEMLKTLYGYEIVESGGKIKVTNALNTYTTPAFTITETDLIDVDNAFSYRRQPDTPIPRTFSLKYIDPDIGYEWATQTWSRNRDDTLHISEGRNELTVPFVMSASSAKEAAFRATYRGFETRTSYSFSLPPSFSELEPGDIIQATINGTAHLIRPIEVTYNQDFTLSINGEEFQVYEEINMPAFAGIPYTAVVKRDTKPFMIPLGLPYLNVDDIPQTDRAVYYYVVSPGELVTTYTGTYGNIGIQFAGTVNWRRLGSSVFSVPIGVLLKRFNPADDGLEHALDAKNVINMRIDSGDPDLLTSATYTEIVNGANLAAVGAPGRWEIIRWQDIALEADGSYTISNIIRGCHNTEKSANTLGLLRWLEQFDYTPAPSGTVAITANTTSQEFIDDNTLSRPGDYFVPLEEEWLKFDTLSVADHAFDYRTLAATQTDKKEGDKVKPVQSLFESEIPPAATDFNVERNSDGFLTFKFNVVPRYVNPLIDGSAGDVQPTRNETNKFCLYIWVPYNDPAAYQLVTQTNTIIVQPAKAAGTKTEINWKHNQNPAINYGTSMSELDKKNAIAFQISQVGYKGSSGGLVFNWAWYECVFAEEVTVATPAVPEISYTETTARLPLIYAYTFEIADASAPQSITLPFHTPAPGLNPDGDAAKKWDVPVGALAGVPSGAQRDLAFPFLYCGVRRLIKNQGPFAPNVRALAQQTFAIKYTGTSGTFGPTNYTKIEAGLPDELYNTGTNGLIYPDPALNEDNGFRAGNIKWTKALVKDV